MRVTFSYPSDFCPECNAHLKVYRVDHRHIKTTYGKLEVIHRIKVCPVEGKKFRSDEPDMLIPPKCI